MDKNTIQLKDMITIVFLALMTNCISELISFIFIYRKKQYKELTRIIDTQTKKIEQLKESLSSTIRQSDKKVKKLEAELKTYNFDMMKVRTKTYFIIGLFMVFFMSIFNSVYQVRLIIFLIFKFLF